MSSRAPEAATGADADAAMANAPPATRSPRADVLGGLGWMALGIAIAVGSWTMDRLTEQDINPYTIPGLVPGLLGGAMIFFAALMLIRGVRKGGLRRASAPRAAPHSYARLVTVVALCLAFAVALVGRMPFWIAAASFVSTTIFVLQYRDRKARGTLARGLLQALAVGIGSGVIVTLVFETFFLVRLP